MATLEEAKQAVRKLADRFLAIRAPSRSFIDSIRVFEREKGDWNVRIGLAKKPEEDLGFPSEEDGIPVVVEGP